jgi:hypothetical protein
MSKALHLPKIGRLAKDLQILKWQINDDMIPEEGGPPCLDITVGWTPGDGYDIQTGDNCFTGVAYGHPHWAVDTLFRRSNCKDLARDLINQLKDLYYQ